MFGSIISGIGSALGLYKTYKDIEDGGSGGGSGQQTIIQAVKGTARQLRNQYPQLWEKWLVEDFGATSGNVDAQPGSYNDWYPTTTPNSYSNRFFDWKSSYTSQINGAVDTVSGTGGATNADGFINWNSNNSGTSMPTLVFMGVLAWGITKVFKELF